MYDWLNIWLKSAINLSQFSNIAILYPNFYGGFSCVFQGGKKGFSKSAKALPRGRSKSPGGKKGKRKTKSVSPAPKKPVDLLSPAAMTNAYYIAHGAQEFLEVRGFGWPDASKKKKKGKGKGKKKKK